MRPDLTNLEFKTTNEFMAHLAGVNRSHCQECGERFDAGCDCQFEKQTLAEMLEREAAEKQAAYIVNPIVAALGKLMPQVRHPKRKAVASPALKRARSQIAFANITTM